MMWNLPRLKEFDARAHLDTAFQNGEVTEAEKDFLVDLYKQYEEGLGRPSAAMEATGQRAELYTLLHDAYSLVQDGRRLRRLRADIKNLADYCPYCGFAPISDLDHHLQRGRYKLLSIFALNLVPCCHPCNTGKRKSPSDNASEHQLHTYLESVAKFDFLRANVVLDPESGGLDVSFSIEHQDGMDDELFSRLKEHLVEFDLRKKYAKQVNIHLSEHEFSFSMAYEGGSEGLKRYLRGTANGHLKNFGVNDWRTALFRGLAVCDSFCDGGFVKALGMISSSEIIAPPVAAI
ncbi:hypothetical protein ACQ859_05750 [Roseateles chitinivorans]|uniref:hypothetical protein n=1 Tax=Roseateles chitinivorans TaxID=2917965 RepID=UPI003D67343C